MEDLSYRELSEVYGVIINMCVDNEIFLICEQKEDGMYVKSSPNDNLPNGKLEKIETIMDLIKYFSKYYSHKINIKYLLQINR